MEISKVKEIIEKLHPWFVSGLVEGEGCFSVSFSFRKKLNVGIETRPSFSISLNERDLSLLKSVHMFFGCGAVRFSRSDRTYKYESRSVAEIVKYVIPHFERYPLKGAKKRDFDCFVTICKGVRANHHLSREKLRDMIDIAYQMNPSGKRKHDKKDLLRILGESKI